jgi:steroid Delta-isomerase
LKLPRHADPRVSSTIEFFESLKPADLARMEAIYSADAYFKDPFNEVRGVVAIRHIFEHMFKALDAPRFVILETVVEGDRCFLVWDFIFRFRGSAAEQTVRGGSHLHFDARDGRITLHRDYWDAAEELYEKLPVLGSLMRWLKRRAKR